MKANVYCTKLVIGVIPCQISTKNNMTPLQIWCGKGEGVYELTQPHHILIKYSWICGHLNVVI